MIHYRPPILLPALCILFAGACDRPSADESPLASFACDPHAFLKTELYGGVRAILDWQARDLACEGMPRPDRQGVRLRMSGPLGDAPDITTVAFILGIPRLEKGATGAEFNTNVTLMEEGTGRFYGTPDTSNCWTDIEFQVPVSPDDASKYRIGGTVYCISPLAEVHGGSSIGFTELKFSSRLNWNPPE